MNLEIKISQTARTTIKSIHCQRCIFNVKWVTAPSYLFFNKKGEIMTTPKEKLNEKISLLNNYEVAEVLDFIEFLQQKKERNLIKALEEAPECDEELSEDEVTEINEAEKEALCGETLSYDEVFGIDNEI
jgi:hypothetical protein